MLGIMCLEFFLRLLTWVSKSPQCGFPPNISLILLLEFEEMLDAINKTRDESFGLIFGGLGLTGQGWGSV